MTKFTEALDRASHPNNEDMRAIDQLSDLTVPLEQSVGKLPASGWGAVRTHHQKFVEMDPMTERIRALSDLAQEKAVESYGLNTDERADNLIDIVRYTKAIERLSPQKEASEDREPAPSRQPDHEQELER